MKGSRYFERISAGALSPQMPEGKAVLIHVGNQEHIADSLSRLHSPGSYTIHTVHTTRARLPRVLERCREAGRPAIVNCGPQLPALSLCLPAGRPYSAALISPGSETGTEADDGGNSLLGHVMADPFAHHFAHLGFQTCLYDPNRLEALRERYFEDMRLGILREDISACEPLLRDARFIFFDLRAVRYSDYPCSSDARPNGLYAEEACRIARYAGLSQKAEAIFLYGGPEHDNPLTICNHLTAEIIWHLCEGIAVNLIEYPDNEQFEDSFQRKIVGLGREGQEIVFVTSCTSNRWWMEIASGRTGRTHLVPCSVKDYQTACTGEVPLKWLFFYQKFTDF